MKEKFSIEKNKKRIFNTVLMMKYDKDKRGVSEREQKRKKF